MAKPPQHPDNENYHPEMAIAYGGVALSGFIVGIVVGIFIGVFFF